MNRYDDYQPDVPALLKTQESRWPTPGEGCFSGDGLGLGAGVAARLRLYLLGALVKIGLHRRLVLANVRLDWFHEFQTYWVGELGNRPLQLHDFFFLSGVYRQRLQTIHFESLEDPALASDDKQLEAWRDPRIVHHLFAHTYRAALSPLRVHRYVRYLPRRGRAAEYGCGTAPLLTALARWYRHLDLQLVGADIPHLLFHYARWKFRHTPFVRIVPITPNDDRPLPGRYDTIFCLEVFEHMPRPLPVLEHFRDVLKPGGHLVFDYIRSEGTGLDTATALRDRLPALDYLRRHFDVVEGRMPTDGPHIEPTVVRKR
jgi:SAM-dependent methyltransferase